MPIEHRPTDDHSPCRTPSTPAERDLPGSIRSLHDTDGGRLLVGVSGRTNLQLELDRPTTLRTPTRTVEVTGLGLWVDEPRDVAQLVRRRRSALPR